MSEVKSVSENRSCRIINCGSFSIKKIMVGGLNGFMTL